MVADLPSRVGGWRRVGSFDYEHGDGRRLALERVGTTDHQVVVHDGRGPPTDVGPMVPTQSAAAEVMVEYMTGQRGTKYDDPGVSL